MAELRTLAAVWEILGGFAPGKVEIVLMSMRHFKPLILVGLVLLFSSFYFGIRGDAFTCGDIFHHK